MNIHHIVLVIHLLCATVWVGGHLILCLGFLPKALRYKDFKYIGDFEKIYEPIGMPSLLLLVVTGIYMAYDFGVDVSLWLSFSNPIERVVSYKLIGIIITLCFALSAQLRVIPKLKKGKVELLKEMGLHIFFVTIIGIILLILGSMIRIGGI